MTRYPVLLLLICSSMVAGLLLASGCGKKTSRLDSLESQPPQNLNAALDLSVDEQLADLHKHADQLINGKADALRDNAFSEFSARIDQGESALGEQVQMMGGPDERKQYVQTQVDARVAELRKTVRETIATGLSDLANTGMQLVVELDSAALDLLIALHNQSVGVPDAEVNAYIEDAANQVRTFVHDADQQILTAASDLESAFQDLREQVSQAVAEELKEIEDWLAKGAPEPTSDSDTD